MNKHAVLYYPDRIMPNMSLLSIDSNAWNNRELAEPCRYLHDLVDLAQENRITHLWVREEIGVFQEEKNYGAYSFLVNYRHKKMQTVTAWKRGTGKVTIIFPHHTSQPSELIDASPKELLVSLAYMEDGLGVTVGGSPAGTGWALLKKLQPTWIEDIPGVNLKECHFDNHAAKDIIWQRPLLSSERTKKYVHKFDKIGQYLAASIDCDTGVGTPVYVDHGRDAIHEKGHPQAVGVWRCTISNPPVQNLYTPPAWDKSDGWIAGPIIRLLRKAGYTVMVHEGWVFPERHDVLTAWANDLWKLRQLFAEPSAFKRPKCAAIARAGIKRIYTATIGMTAFRGFDEDEDGDNEKRRPDMRMQVRARAREVMYHNIEKVRMMYGATPAIVYMDALYYFSDEPNGRAFLPDLVKRDTALGGFKYEGHIEVTPDILAMFDEKMSAGNRLEFLNKKGWVK